MAPGGISFFAGDPPVLPCGGCGCYSCGCCRPKYTYQYELPAATNGPYQDAEAIRKLEIELADVKKQLARANLELQRLRHRRK